MKNKKELILLILILLVTTVLRFYNLMHDSPYFFNPDERNMAGAITRFVLPAKLSQIPNCIFSELLSNRPKSNDQSPTTNCTLNPHFFSYGQFPLYLAFVSNQIFNPKTNDQPASPAGGSLMTSFPSAIYWLRFYSALSSVATVFVVFLISRIFLSPKFSLLSSILVAFSPGLIQSAHFGTTESLLTCLFMSVIYLSIKLSQNLSNLKYLILISLAIGLSLGSKLTGLFFFFPPFLVLLLEIQKSARTKRKKIPVFILGLLVPAKKLFQVFLSGSVIIIITLATFIVSSPYNLVEPENFESAVFGYESDVATGNYEAFYTRQFVNTVPFLFQSEKIFPYVLGWPTFILGSLGLFLINIQLFFMLIFSIISKFQSSKLKAQKLILNKYLDLKNLDLFLILIFGFWFYLIPNSLLFAKWSRFMTPILPFFAIFSGYFIYRLSKLLNKKIFLLFAISYLLFAIVPGLAFMSIYSHEDTRVTSSRWIYKYIPDKSYVLSETANVIDIPLGLPKDQRPTTNDQMTVISFDFYHLNENPILFNQLISHLEKADYIFIPSRRIFKNHDLQPQKYKLVTKYYQLIFSGALGFEKQTEISSFPALSLGSLKWEFPDENAEETFTVFDHPVIRIYKKVTSKTTEEYNSLFRSHPER